MYKKILVPVDASQTALNAAKHAVTLARSVGAEYPADRVRLDR